MSDHKDEPQIRPTAPAEVLEMLRLCAGELAELREPLARAGLKQEGENCEERAMQAAAILASYNDEPARTNRLAIVVEGGLVQSVLSDDPALRTVKLFVVDYDTNGAVPEDEDGNGIMRITYNDGKGYTRTEAAYVRGEQITEPGIDLAAIEKFTEE